MGDPDIQSVFHKSYSLEDLALVDEEAEEVEEVEAALDAVVSCLWMGVMLR